MRHQCQVSHFGRKTGARQSLIRGLLYSLVEHERIQTTLAKAKELRRHADRAITVGKKNSLHATRILLARYPNQSAVSKIVKDLAPRFEGRNGGYTRILKLGQRRNGDNAEMAFIEWVDYKLPDLKKKSDSDEKTEKKEAAPRKAKAGGSKTKKTSTAKKAKKSKKK